MQQQRFHQRLHTVPTWTVFLSLREDLDEFAGGNGAWWVCVALSDGTLLMRSRDDDAPPPPIDVIEKAVEVTIRLNREWSNGGHWFVSWADDQMTLFWRDRDGDLQFTDEFAEPWPRLKRMPVMEFAARGALAWEMWNNTRKDLEWDPARMVKRAQGERSPTSRRP